MVQKTQSELDREARNVALRIVKRNLSEAQGQLDYLILATPTSERHNTLTDVNIHLMEAARYIANLQSEES